MCGIAGLVTENLLGAGDRLDRMTASLAHRGPDGEGVVFVDGVGLGHRRLKVIDLTDNGRQPMANEDGSVWITYNGEIYDFAPLRQRLQARGHQFRSRTDTEVLLHLYEEEGPGLFESINGMFAFAIYDRRTKSVLLGRDRLGVKPLHYTVAGDELLFGSELKSIFAGLGRRPPLRAEALGQYLLQGYVNAPETAFPDVFTLPPGHYLRVSRQQLRDGQVPSPVEYWDAPFTGDDPGPAARIEIELEERLAEAVQACMVADVPLGAFLSGGIDSSSVVALMARASREPVRTFTVDVPGTDRSERTKAAAVARKYGTMHVEIDSTTARADEYWACVRHFDAPFNCPSLLNANLVSRATRRHVTVALSGDGGDELFGGYQRYLNVAEKGGRPLTPALVTAASSMLPGDLRGRARLERLGYDDFMRYFVVEHPLPVRTVERLTDASLQPWVERMRSIYERYPADRLTRAMYFDLKTYLPDHVLAKVDSASMAASLEVRVPLLDHRVVELAGRIPSGFKLRNGAGKWILKRLARTWLPEDLIDQQKVGFDPPLASWLFDAQLSRRLDELSSRNARFRQVLDGREIDRLIASLRNGSRWRVPRRAALWAVYQLEQWLQGQERTQAARVAERPATEVT